MNRRRGSADLEEHVAFMQREETRAGEGVPVCVCRTGSDQDQDCDAMLAQCMYAVRIWWKRFAASTNGRRAIRQQRACEVLYLDDDGGMRKASDGVYAARRWMKYCM